MSEIANGYSWYKFDIEGWLTSPDVQQMNMAERGMYHHLITIQARDGKLAASILSLAKQAGVDRRVVEKWLKNWGYLFPIIEIAPEVVLASALRPCSEHAASVQLTCSMCAPPPLPLRCFPAACWMRAGSFRVNPKQWNLSVKSGKFSGQPLLEERREVLEIEGEERGDRSMARYKPKQPQPQLLAKGEGA